MKKQRQLFLKVATESLNNARLWLEEAIHLLYERQSFGHSVSLSLFSIEEAIKGWMCFAVAIGSAEPSDPMVKEVFYSHPSKIESAVMWWFILNVPALQQTFSKLLTDEEQDQLIEYMEAVDEAYINSTIRLVNLRMKGMYVDVLDGAVISPLDMTKFESEGMLFDAQTFVRLFEMVLKNYNEASPEEKLVWIEKTKVTIKLAVENWELMKSKSDSRNVVERE